MMKFLNIFAAILASQCHAFVVMNSNQKVGMKKSTPSELAALLSMELEKPLGIILEEVEENAPQGVKVEELSDAGSAYASEYRDQLVGLKVMQVMDTDVSNMVFDDVMECIIDAPSPVNIAFEVADEADDVEAQVETFELGTTVQIKVIQECVEDKVIEAKVGDNLRKTLLENKVELYRGLKKKLGNCGGGGQCTFCAVDFAESEGWQERSDYENTKIGKFPTARLACMNNIQGPATVRVQ
jgi:ferredoxin